jgi:hypothetical protein
MTDNTHPHDTNQLAKSIIDSVTGQQPSPVQGMTGNSAEVPNMTQRTVLQCLNLDDWKIVARLPVSVGERVLRRMCDYGWVETRGEKQHTAIRLTPAGLKAMQSVKPSAGRSRSGRRRRGRKNERSAELECSLFPKW